MVFLVEYSEKHYERDDEKFYKISYKLIVNL
jgi:hypothetical protein